MSYAYSPPVAALGDDARAAFLTRTYAHLLGAILAFAGLEVALFKSGLAEPIAVALSGNWLLVLGALMLVGWLSSRTAASSASRPMQYAALAAYVVMYAVIFVPLLYVAEFQVGGGVIASAAWVTLLGFTALTAIVFVTGKDFSFMGGMLKWIGILAIGAIVGSLLFDFTLGTWFSVAMIAFAGAAILYDTSNVLHHYPEDRYVSAALELFGSVALMFWYVLRLFMSRD